MASLPHSLKGTQMGSFALDYPLLVSIIGLLGVHFTAVICSSPLTRGKEHPGVKSHRVGKAQHLILGVPVLQLP